jgi:hypothetical protein
MSATTQKYPTSDAWDMPADISSSRQHSIHVYLDDVTQITQLGPHRTRVQLRTGATYETPLSMTRVIAILALSRRDLITD